MRFTYKKKSQRSRRVPAVLSILSGSLVGQGAVIAVSPLLTRLYSPADFGALALVTAVAAIAGGFVSLSWEAAVALPEDDDDARILMWLAMISSFALSSVLGLVLFLLRVPLARTFDSGIFVDYWWLAPITVLFTAVFSTLSSWRVRRMDFRKLATRNAIQGLAQATSSVVLGFAGVAPLGLASSLAIGRAAGVFGMIASKGVSNSGVPRLRRVVQVARRYKKFPLLTSPSAVINSLGLQAPILLLAAIYGSVAIGLLALAMRVLAAPIGILADAVSQYFVGVFANNLHTGKRSSAQLILGIVRRLALVGLLPTIIVAALGPQLFSMVFGHQWTQAGIYAQILIVVYYFQLVVSPISRTLGLLERQGLQLAWDLGRVILAASTILIIAVVLDLSEPMAIAGFAVAQAASYLFLLGAILVVARRHDAASASNREALARASTAELATAEPTKG